MALWVRSGGFGLSWQSPEILPSAPPVASPTTAGMWKKRMGIRAGEGVVCCSSEPRETEPQKQFTLRGKMEMEIEQYVGIMCDLCNGIGWLVCDFCEGQKTNVKSQSSRFYRRCPNCRAAGLVLCPKCKVFKCVTFPDSSDAQA